MEVPEDGLLWVRHVPEERLMATTGPMHLTMDLARYWKLPPGVKAQFDGWLDAENLTERRVMHLTLTEGAVVIERFATDDEGKVLIEDGEPVRVTETVPVSTLPPKEAF